MCKFQNLIFRYSWIKFQCVCITLSSFSHLLIDIQAGSRSFLLWIGQPWTWMEGCLCGSVREITCLPSEESLHRLWNEGRASLQQKILLACICVGTCILHTLVSLNLCQVWLQLNNLNRDRCWQVLLLRQIGDLHSKDITYCQNYFKYRSIVLFHVVVTKDHLAHLTELCFPWWESTGDLMAEQDLPEVCSYTTCCVLSFRSLSLVWESGLMTGHKSASCLLCHGNQSLTTGQYLARL